MFGPQRTVTDSTGSPLGNEGVCCATPASNEATEAPCLAVFVALMGMILGHRRTWKRTQKEKVAQESNIVKLIHESLSTSLARRRLF